MNLPPTFIAKIHRFFGDEGRAWLPQLPEIAAQCRTKWHLAEGTLCETMSINYIEFTTTAAGDPVALKIGIPNPEMFTEMEALRLYDGQGAVRLLDTDRDLGAILMQQIQPGTMLWQVGNNDEATRIAASMMRQLPVPVPPTHTLPTFAHWVNRAFHLTRTTWDPTEQMPRDLLDEAEKAFQEIAQTSPGNVVLHGDLHHENIVFDEQAGWVAIDPKGVIGPPILEVGRFLQNQLPTTLSVERREAIVRKRVSIFSAELGYPEASIAASALVDCVLSHCWSFEEENGINDDWYYSLTLGRLLCDML